MSERGDIIRGAGAHLKRNSNLGVGVGAPYGGSEGDVRVQMVDGSPRLYGRAGGEWYSVNLHKTNTDGYKLGSGPDYLDITNTGFEIVNDNKLYAELDKGTLTLGGDITNNDKIVMDSTGMALYSGSSTASAQFGTSVVLRGNSSDDDKITISSTGIVITENTTDNISLLSGVITIGDNSNPDTPGSGTALGPAYFELGSNKILGKYKATTAAGSTSTTTVVDINTANDGTIVLGNSANPPIVLNILI